LYNSKYQKTHVVTILIFTFALIFVTEQNVNGGLHEKLDKSSSITANHSIEVTTSAPRAAKRSQSIEANGTISSLIFLTQTPTNSSDTAIKIHNASGLVTARKYILFGDWDLIVNSGKVSNFDARFEQILEDAGRFHTHEISNFKTKNSTVVSLTSNGNIFIHGMVDVKYNGTITWSNVDVNIVILRGKTIQITLDNNETDNHFQGQHIYGIVKSLKESI
jgi:hypothetical protein